MPRQEHAEDKLIAAYDVHPSTVFSARFLNPSMVVVTVTVMMVGFPVVSITVVVEVVSVTVVGTIIVPVLVEVTRVVNSFVDTTEDAVTVLFTSMSEQWRDM